MPRDTGFPKSGSGARDRVLRSGGGLGDYTGGIEPKRALLALEAAE